MQRAPVSAQATPWNWRGLDSGGAGDLWDELVAWVCWLVRRYGLSEEVPACWWAHGAMVEELTALRAAWVAAFEEPSATMDAPLGWHERFAAARARLAGWDRLGCRRGTHRPDDAVAWVIDEEALKAHIGDDTDLRPWFFELDAELVEGQC